MEKLILTIVTILGVLIAFKFKGVFHKIISIGLAISILLVWTESKHITISSFIILTLTIATCIYGLTAKKVNVLEKISIATMGLFLFVSLISKLFYFPGAEIIRLSMIVPIIITLVVFFKERQLTREMSFMIFWLFYTGFEFSRAALATVSHCGLFSL